MKSDARRRGAARRCQSAPRRAAPRHSPALRGKNEWAGRYERREGVENSRDDRAKKLPVFLKVTMTVPTTVAFFLFFPFSFPRRTCARLSFGRLAAAAPRRSPLLCSSCGRGRGSIYGEMSLYANEIYNYVYSTLVSIRDEIHPRKSATSRFPFLAFSLLPIHPRCRLRLTSCRLISP